MTKMTAVARAAQAVRAHVPLIRFPDRSSKVVTGLQATSAAPSAPAPVAPVETASARVTPQATSTSQPVYTKPVGYTPRGSGAEWHTLPERYQRRPISQEEMEYIERGGPE